MNPQIASGNPYNAGSVGTGVGAVFTGEGNEFQETMQAFTNSYSLANQWRKEKEAEAAQKQKRLDGLLEDLDFKTTGIRATDAEYFQKGKEAIHNHYKNAYNNSTDPNDPRFRKEYNEGLMGKKAYSTMVDASIAHQKQLTEDYNILKAHPNDFDYDKSVEEIRKRSTMPLELVIKDGVKSALVPNNFNESAAIMTRMKDVKPNETTEVDKDGQVHDVKELGALDPKLGVRPRMLDLAQAEIDANPKYRDAVMKRFTQTPPAFQTSMTDRAKRLTQQGHATSAEALFAYPQWETEAYAQDKGGKWTPWAEAYARQSAKHAADDKDDEKKNLFENQRDTQIYIGSPAAYFTGADGLRHIRNPWSIPIKKYQQTATDNKGKVTNVAVPATVTDIIHMGYAGESSVPLVKVQDSYSIEHPNDPKLGTDENGYYDVDMNDLLTQKRQATNPKDWVRAQNSWVKFHKGHGSWDNGVVNGKATGLSEMDPEGYDYINRDEEMNNAEKSFTEKGMQSANPPGYVPKSSIKGANTGTEEKKKDWSKYKRK